MRKALGRPESRYSRAAESKKPSAEAAYADGEPMYTNRGL